MVVCNPARPIQPSDKADYGGNQSVPFQEALPISAMNLMSQAKEIDLFDAAGLLWRRRWWLVLVTIAFTAMFAALAFTMTPIYRASVVAVPAGKERAGLGGMLSAALGSFGGLASLAGVNVNAAVSETDEALAVLRSRQFIGKFINDRKLLPVLFPDKWDAKRGSWKVPEGEVPSLSQAAKYFLHDILSVSQDKKTGLVTVQVEWRDRLATADWANDLVRRINATMRERAISSSDSSLVYLRKELDAASVVEARVAISRLIETQINQKMISSVTTEYAFRVVEQATPSDRGDTSRPNRPLMLLFGFILGAFVAVAGTILLALVQTSKQANLIRDEPAGGASSPGRR